MSSSSPRFLSRVTTTVDDALRNDRVIHHLLQEETDCFLFILGAVLVVQSAIIVCNYLAFRLRLRRSVPVAPWVVWVTHIVTISLVLLPLGLWWFASILPPPCDPRRALFMKRLDHFVQGYFVFLFVGNTLAAIFGPNGDLHRGVWRWPSISFVLTRVFVVLFNVTSWIGWWIVKEMVRNETAKASCERGE